MVTGIDIFRASDAGSLRLVQILVRRDRAQVNKQDFLGFTPLHYAARKGHAHVVGFLLEEGADPGITTNGGFTALELAEIREHREVAELLRRREQPVA